MNEKDREAFEKWYQEYIKTITGFNNAIGTGSLTIETWQAACEYKQKQIDELINWNEIIANEMNTYISIANKALAENSKLRDCAEFYADTGSWDAVEASDTSVISGVISQDDIYSPWEEQGITVGGRRAKEVLKELV